MANGYIWCTYRDWSFRILEGLQDFSGWSPRAIITTKNCLYDLSKFEKRGVPILRIDPKELAAPDASLVEQIKQLNPSTIFYYGWSWIVPSQILALCPNVTLHPGKLPLDRGGSPIQNQIRNGEKWTYANVLLMSEKLDAGPVFTRQQISLDGDSADWVWSRMITSGLLATQEYLQKLASGDIHPTSQDSSIEPTFYKRVTSAQAEILPAAQSALQMFNVVRAHSESDPNTYVKAAFLKLNERRLVIERASLSGSVSNEVDLTGISGNQEMVKICAKVNNQEIDLFVKDTHGTKLYLKRIYLSI